MFDQLFGYGSNAHGQLSMARTGLNFAWKAVPMYAAESHGEVKEVKQVQERLLNRSRSCKYCLSMSCDFGEDGEEEEEEEEKEEKDDSRMRRMIEPCNCIDSHAVAGKQLDVLTAASGKDFSIVASRDRTLYACGLAKDGRLGLGVLKLCERDKQEEEEEERWRKEEDDAEHVETLTEIRSMRGVAVDMIACGSGHTLLLTKEGTLYSWGCNRFGQLGFGESASLDPVLSPHRVSELEHLVLTHVACGGFHSLVVSSDGALLSCGWNLAGQLGLPPSQEAFPKFGRVRLPGWAGQVVSCAGGHSFSVAVSRSGLVLEWGCADYWWEHRHLEQGMEGGWPRGGGEEEEEEGEEWKPAVVQLPERATTVSCGYQHYSVLCRSGRVYSFPAAFVRWGKLPAGGLAAFEVSVGERRREEMSNVTCGYGHTLAMLAHGRVLAWSAPCGPGQRMRGATIPLSSVPKIIDNPNATMQMLWVKSGCCAEHLLIGYSSQLSQEAVIAFLMGTHPRLGSCSPILLLDPCISVAIARL